MIKRRVSIGDNKFLTILIIFAILISVLGTFFSINMLNELNDYKEYFTGYGTSGTVNITISQNLSINVLMTNMTFGTGFVNTGADHATLNSTNMTQAEFGPALAGANWTNTTDFNPDRISLVNGGNVNASVTVTSDKIPSTFMGGTSPGFEFNASNKEANSCVEAPASWTTLTGGADAVCTNMGSTDTKDELYIDVRLTIPYDSQGNKEATFTFGASAVP